MEFIKNEMLIVYKRNNIGKERSDFFFCIMYMEKCLLYIGVNAFIQIVLENTNNQNPSFHGSHP